MRHQCCLDIVKDSIRTIANWPKPGIIFHDLTPIFKDPYVFHILIDLLSHRYIKQDLDLIAGIDARGFILGSILAYKLNIGFVPIRKKGKLPFETISEEYTLEYDSASIEVHADSVTSGQCVLLIDDLIATGGTINAAVKLMRRLGANIIEIATIIDLQKSGGSITIKPLNIPFFSLFKY